MKLIRKFESYSQEREEMCKYLCNVCGCSMHDLHDKSDEELEDMCRTMGNQDSHMHMHNENMNSIKREEMCRYLCRCGYSEEELEMCSEEELMHMCRAHSEEDENNNNMEEANESKRLRRISEHQELQNYMFFSNLGTIKRLVDEMLEMDESKLDGILSEHDWASDHISVAAENIEHVFNFFVDHDEPHTDFEETEDEMRGIKNFGDFKK